MLYEAANNLVKEANELKEMIMDQMFDLDTVETMTGEEFEMFKKMYKLVDDSMKLVLEQNKLFDEMDNKLDKIVKKLEA